MIKALFKFDKAITADALIIDTTSNSGEFRELSPFVLPAPPARNFENLWQFSKVYPCHLWNGEPSKEWHIWRDAGFTNNRAVRYPMGKGAKPLYSFWQGEHLDYIQARKQIYIPEYAKNVSRTNSFKRLYDHCRIRDVILLDYDAYDHQLLGMDLIDVVNNPNRKMGHAFVLLMMITGCLEECVKSQPGGAIKK